MFPNKKDHLEDERDHVEDVKDRIEVVGCIAFIDDGHGACKPLIRAWGMLHIRPSYGEAIT